MNKVDDIELLASYYKNKLSSSKRSKIENRKRTDLDFRQLAEEIRSIILERPEQEADEIIQAMIVTELNSDTAAHPTVCDMERKELEHRIQIVKAQERQRRKTINLMMILSLFLIALIVTFLYKWING